MSNNPISQMRSFSVRPRRRMGSSVSSCSSEPSLAHSDPGVYAYYGGCHGDDSGSVASTASLSVSGSSSSTCGGGGGVGGGGGGGGGAPPQHHLHQQPGEEQAGAGDYGAQTPQHQNNGAVGGGEVPPRYPSRRVSEYEKRSRHAFRKTYQKLGRQGVTVTPLDNIPYVHGGYAASAPLMVDDGGWMGVLAQLMPVAHADAVRLIRRGSDAMRLMKWAENNPVVAAYGVLQGQPQKRYHEDRPLGRRFSYLPIEEQKQSWSSCDDSANAGSSSGRRRRKKSRVRSREPNTTAIEWDVFLDPNIVADVERAMDAAEGVGGDDVHSRMVAEIEVDRQVGRLLARTLLAHGSASQLVTEALGVAPKYNFSKVAETTQLKIGKSKCRGIFVERWLEIFEAALRLGRELTSPFVQGDRPRPDHLRRSQSVVVGGPGHAGAHVPTRPTHLGVYGRRHSVGDFGDVSLLDEDGDDDDLLASAYPEQQLAKPALCGLFLCLGMTDPNSERTGHGSNSMAESLRSIRELLGGTHLGVVLDLKSRRVPPRVWARLVDNLRSRGLAVKGMGSFDVKELRDVAKSCSTPVTPIIFLHSAGDLQRACHVGEIKRGDTVYFNAGSLLWQKPSILEAADIQCCSTPESIDDPGVNSHYVVQPFAHPRSSLDILPHDLSITSTIQDYQRHYDLNIGVYVQEFSICEDALEVLVNFVNFHSSLYNVGMAWGGLNGATIKGVQGDGFWNQRFMGRNWDLHTGPTDTLELTGEDNDLVREAIMAVACAQAGTANDEEVQELSNAIQQGACAPGHGHDTFSDARTGTSQIWSPFKPSFFSSSS